MLYVAICFVALAPSSASSAESTALDQWQYHWGDFNYPDIPPDQSWQNFNPSKPPPGRDGSRLVWYRYKIPDTLFTASYLFVPGVYQLYQVFHDGKQTFTFGEFTEKNTTGLLGQQFHILDLPRSSDGWLYFRIFSEFKNIGFNGLTMRGAKDEIISYIVRKDLPRVVVSCLFIFIGCFQFFLFRTRSAFIEYIAFGGFAVLFGIHSFARTNLKQLIFDEPVLWKYVEILTVFYLPIFLCLFIEKTFGAGYKNVIRHIRWINTAFCAGITVFSINNLTMLERVESTFVILFTPGCFFLMASVIAEKNARKRDVVAFTVGLIILAATGLVDGLVVSGVIPYINPIAPWGTLAFLFSFQMILSDKIAKARIQKFEVEKDLETAALLTTGFLPGQTYNSDKFAIDVLFDPAGQIGGDWYSYYLEHERWLHVHIGDVTGHSTAAALIAAFSKGATDMIYASSSHDRRRTLRLEVLHKNLNTILSKSHNLNPLMTFFSAVIDLETGIMHYLNSGHTFPLVVSPQKSTFLVKGKSRNLLGLNTEGKIFQSNTYQLTGDEWLFFYSDGYLDAAGMNSPQGIKSLKETLKTSATKDDHAFTNLVRTLIENPETRSSTGDDITAISVKLNFTASPIRKLG